MRARWRSWLSLAIFIAVAGGAVITLVAGAQRTATAYSRFLSAQRAPDGEVYVGGPGVQPGDVQRLPQVTNSAVALGLASTESDFVPAVIMSRRGEINRFKILSGRALRPDRADEAVVGFRLASDRHLQVGSRLPIHFLTSSDLPPVTVGFRIVGIEALPGEFPPRLTSGANFAYLPPAFLRTTVGTQATRNPSYVVFVRLRHGAQDLGSLTRDLYRLQGGPVGVTKMADLTASVQRSLHFQVVALYLLAGLAGLTLALILAQLLLREASFQAGRSPPLRALGMTSAQLLASAMMSVAVSTVAAATGAVALGVALSPLLPIGTARIAEPHPGFAIDVAVLALGALAIVTSVGLIALLCLVRGAQLERFRKASGPARFGSVMPLARLPVTVAIGTRMALQPGRGQTSVPVRTTLTAVAIGVAATIGVVTFGASLSHLLATPRLYGVTFDADIEGNGNFGDVRPIIPALKADPAIEAITVGGTGVPLQSGVVSFGAQYMTAIRGSIDPPLTIGRLPHAADEIALGSLTLAALHAHVGDTIPIALSGFRQGPVSVHVVGGVVLPTVTDTEQLGRGAVVMPEFLSVLRLPPGFHPPPPGDVLVRFRPGADAGRQVATLRREIPPIAVIYRPVQPTEVVNFGQVRNLPTILAGLLAGIAAATIAHLNVSGIRRRRTDLAVLKILGLTPRNVSAVVAWQSTTVSLIALVVAVPVGVAAGHWAWSLVASRLGSVSEPSTPLMLILALTIATVLIANLIATIPAIKAGHIKPATALRAE